MLAVVTVAVAGVLAVLWGRDGTSEGAGGSSVARPQDTTPMAGTWAVPKAFLGEWKGVAGNSADRYEIVLVVKSGKNGEEVASTTFGTESAGLRCERIERLVVAEEHELTFAARNVGGARCGADGGTSTVVLTADGAMEYRAQVNGEITGTLRKA